MHSRHWRKQRALQKRFEGTPCFEKKNSKKIFFSRFSVRGVDVAMKITRLFLNHSPRTFSGSGIRLRLLASRRQTATMADPPVAAKIH